MVGAAGVHQISHYTRHVLRGYPVHGERVTGSKTSRAIPVAAAAENGLIKLVRARNLNDALDELSAFPNGPHDDVVDALAGAHQALSSTSFSAARTFNPNSVKLPTARRHPLDRHARRPVSLSDLAARLGTTVYDPHRPPP